MGARAVMSGPLSYTGALGSDQALIDAIAQAWGYVLPGGRIQGTSGARPGGRASSQHYTGDAWDYGVFRADGTQVRWDDPEVLAAGQIAASMGLMGFGWGPEYMGGSYFHFDNGENPYAPRGGVTVWSDDDGGASDRGAGAAQYGDLLRAAAGMGLEGVLAQLGIDQGGGFNGLVNTPSIGGGRSGAPAGGGNVPGGPGGGADPALLAALMQDSPVPTPFMDALAGRRSGGYASLAPGATTSAREPSAQENIRVAENQNRNANEFGSLLEEISMASSAPQRRIRGLV